MKKKNHKKEAHLNLAIGSGIQTQSSGNGSLRLRRLRVGRYCGRRSDLDAGGPETSTSGSVFPAMGSLTGQIRSKSGGDGPNTGSKEDGGSDLQ
ncbi:hypothetical protein M6B38_157305 [Iris pallida]|uniref:Uncharacterized protein n=1 Tax=Iris pallida TaxID=29817 RepID=A0AAX6F0S3_IRIPA|nr:hypothetical protein M6B38_157305 [Iris pallida]